jgi:hypothetical protein
LMVPEIGLRSTNRRAALVIVKIAECGGGAVACVCLSEGLTRWNC